MFTSTYYGFWNYNTVTTEKLQSHQNVLAIRLLCLMHWERAAWTQSNSNNIISPSVVLLCIANRFSKYMKKFQYQLYITGKIKVKSPTEPQIVNTISRKASHVDLLYQP
jgi:hypothetical protein